MNQWMNELLLGYMGGEYEIHELDKLKGSQLWRLAFLTNLA